MSRNFLFFVVAACCCLASAHATSINTGCYTLQLGGEWKESPGGTGKDRMLYLPRNSVYARISCAETTISPADYSAFTEFAATKNAEIATEELSRQDPSVELAEKATDSSDDEVKFRYLWRGKDSATYQTHGKIRNGKMLVVTIRSVGLSDAKHAELVKSVTNAIRLK